MQGLTYFTDLAKWLSARGVMLAAYVQIASLDTLNRVLTMRTLFIKFKIFIYFICCDVGLGGVWQGASPFIGQ